MENQWLTTRATRVLSTNPTLVVKQGMGRYVPSPNRADRDPASHSRRRSEVLEGLFTGNCVRVACRRSRPSAVLHGRQLSRHPDRLAAGPKQGAGHAIQTARPTPSCARWWCCAQTSAVVGSMTRRTMDTWSAGKPPCRACVRTIASSGAL